MNISWKQKNKQPALLFRSWSGLAVLKSVTAPGKMAVTFNASCSAVMLRNDSGLGMSNVAGWLAYLEHLIITCIHSGWTEQAAAVFFTMDSCPVWFCTDTDPFCLLEDIQRHYTVQQHPPCHILPLNHCHIQSYPFQSERNCTTCQLNVSKWFPNVSFPAKMTKRTFTQRGPLQTVGPCCPCPHARA